MTPENADSVSAKEMLDKLISKKPHCAYFEEGKDPKWDWGFLIFFVLWTGAVFGCSMAYHNGNDCINYTGASYVGIFSLYGGICALTLILLAIYCRHVKFCSVTQRRNHTALAFALVSAVGSTLNWYDFYSINLNLFAAGMAFFMSYVVFLLFIAVFLEGHLRSCPEHRTHFRIVDVHYAFAFDCLVGFWFLAWICFILIVCFYDGDIYTMPNRSIYCVSVNSD